MQQPEVDWSICQSCDPCEARRACRTRAILQIDPGESIYIELARCNGCSKCVPACTFGAIVMMNSAPGNNFRRCR